MTHAARRLSGRIALVTGASRGIGAAARAGAGAAPAPMWWLLARTVGGLEELDDAMRAAGGTATLVPLDITRFRRARRLAAAVYERYGRLDVLVGNAAIVGPSSPLDHLTPKDWDAVMAVNVTANWQLIRAMDALLRALRRRPRGVHHLRRGATRRAPIWAPIRSRRRRSKPLARTYAAETASNLGARQPRSIPARPAPACAPR